MNLSVYAEEERPAPARSVNAAIAYLGSYSRKSQSPNDISIETYTAANAQFLIVLKSSSLRESFYWLC